MTGPVMSPEETEDGLSNLFRSLQVGPGARGLDEGFFEKVRSLLSSAGKPEWSKRPRSYTVLRMINRVDALDRMVMEGCLDLHFPFSDLSVPEPLKASSVRFKFLDAQKLVVTKATSMETETGQHAHFHSDANVHFHILNPLLGRGAFGVVDHVRSKLSLNEFARKRISRARTFAKDKAAMKVFENELRNLRRLKHIHLVEVVGSYTDPKFIGLLMSPIAETTLKIFLDAHQCPNHTGKLPLLRQFVGCLAGAVSYLHAQKCRHKDIKPSNILIKGDHVLLTDFGTARDWSDRTHGTTTGPTGPYTPGYASPEVVDQAPRGEPSDIWSLGCVYLDILTVLTGDTFAERTAFFESHGTGLALVRSNFEAFPSYMDHLAVKGPGDRNLQMWIGRMLQANPAQRITASALFEQIQDQVDELQYYGECCFDSGYSTDGSDAASTFMDDTIVPRPGITTYDQSKDAANHRPPNADVPRETYGQRNEQEERIPQNFTTFISNKDIHDKEPSESGSDDSGLPESKVLDVVISHVKEVFTEILQCEKRRNIPLKDTSGVKSFEEIPTLEKRGPRSHEVCGIGANKAQPDSVFPPADQDGVPPSRWYNIANPKQVVARHNHKGALGNLRKQIALLLDSDYRAFRNNPTKLMHRPLSACDAHLRNGLYKDAEESAMLAVSKDRTNALPWLFVAEARMGLENREGALGAYERAFVLSSGDTTVELLDDLSQVRFSFLESKSKGRGINTTGAVIGAEDYQATLDELAIPWESSKDEPLETLRPLPAVRRVKFDAATRPRESSSDESSSDEYDDYERYVPGEGSYQTRRSRKDTTTNSPRLTREYDDNGSTTANVGFDRERDESPSLMEYHQDGNPRDVTYHPSLRQQWQPLLATSRLPDRYVDKRYRHVYAPYSYSRVFSAPAPSPYPHYDEQVPMYTSQADRTTKYLASNPGGDTIASRPHHGSRERSPGYTRFTHDYEDTPRKSASSPYENPSGPQVLRISSGSDDSSNSDNDHLKQSQKPTMYRSETIPTVKHRRPTRPATSRREASLPATLSIRKRSETKPTQESMSVGSDLNACPVAIRRKSVVPVTTTSATVPSRSETMPTREIKKQRAAPELPTLATSRSGVIQPPPPRLSRSDDDSNPLDPLKLFEILLKR